MPTKVYYATLLWLFGTIDQRVRRRQDVERDDDADRGDVPGWVMITVMTAIVVIALLAVFKTQVTTAVTDAFKKVTGAD